MTMQQQYVVWVQPLAQSYAEVRAATAQLSRTLSVGELARAAGDEGWSVRDEIVHTAAADPDFIGVLGAILAGEQPDTSLFANIDERNRRNLDAWQGRSMDAIAAELDDSARLLDGLLARLTDADERRRPDGLPFDLGEFLSRYGQHAPYHLGQVREALRQTAEE